MHRNPTKKSKYIKRPTLKYKAFAYLCALCLFTVALLWVFQIFLLDEFYYHVTVSNIKDTAISYRGIGDQELQQHTDFASADPDISILVCNSKGEVLARSSEHPNSLIRHFGTEMLRGIYSKAKSNGGEYIQEFDFSDIAIKKPDSDKNKNPAADEALPQIPQQTTPDTLPTKPTTQEQFPSDTQSSDSVAAQRLVYSKIVSADNGADRLILFDCSLTPVGNISETIKIQLSIITLLCIVFSLCTALLFSYRVSAPISKINEKAKLLGKGQYDITFEGGGCREIDELSSTLEYAAKELSKLEKMQNELISNISHDLRTPLTMIGGYAEVMRDIPGENTPENVQVIIDETKRLSSLVNNLLEISKLQKDAKDLKYENFDLTELVRETVSRFEKLNENKGYAITLDAQEDAHVYADKEKISQVLYNLIGNAINYTGTDKQVYVRQTTADSIVMIEICDTGDGIEPEKLPKIWQRYYRADKFHKRSEVGMGIGLSIVKDILDAHNAAFGVTSKLGHGSVFWFKLHTTKDQ